jgi:hypothetical protein
MLGNYMRKVLALYNQLMAEGKIKGGEHYHTRCAHDDWCNIYSKSIGVCNCDPDVSLHLHTEPNCLYCEVNGGFGNTIGIPREAPIRP